MSKAHKEALAKGREEGRTIRRYLDALESTRRRPGRQRTPESIQKQLVAIDTRLASADQLTRLNLVEQQRRLKRELTSSAKPVDISALEKDFVKVAKSYGERKGITYSSWRAVGVSATTLSKAKIPRTRG